MAGSDRDVVVVAGVRTPFALAGAELSDVPALELARIAAREVVERSDIDPGEVDELLAGTVRCNSGDAARAIALLAKLPDRVAALTVSRADATGLACLVEAALRIRGGECETVLAVAFDSSPRPSAGRAAHSSLAHPVTGVSPGEAAERLAREFAIDREAQDRFAVRSHERAAAARDSGALAAELVAVPIGPQYRAMVERDGGVRDDVSLDGFTRLPPVLDRAYGTVTEANAAPEADGAVAVLLTSGRFAAARGFPAFGRIISWGFAGCDPRRAGLGPVLAAPVALRRAGRATLGQIDRIEIHEGSAAQVLACLRAFGSRRFAERHLSGGPVGEVDPGIVNDLGGAIAYGHPAGASGARMVLGLLRGLERSGLRRGLAAMAVDGGQGAAMIVEAGG